MIDPTTPSSARMYNYFLGGKDNYESDRVAAAQVAAAFPSIPQAARANRDFLVRAVQWCAQEADIGQFLDIGTGIPTSPNVSEVAAKYRPGSVAVGIDNDPLVLVHGRELARMHMIAGDARDPGAILAHSQVSEHIDWDRPVAVLLVAVLHFIPGDRLAAQIVATFRDRLVTGSLIVISHVCSTGADPKTIEQIEAVYKNSSSPGRARTHEEIVGFFDGLDLVPPGVVDVQDWRPTAIAEPISPPVRCGIGRVR